jgi:hypothetical protein
MCDGHLHLGEKGGCLAQDSSFRCAPRQKVVGRRIWRNDQLSCDHKFGKDAGGEGTHGVGKEADVGGGGQQTCVVEVTCVEASDQRRACGGTCTLMR